MPWEKKKERNASNNNQVYSTVGALALYKMKLSKNEEGVVDGWTFTQCWAKSFALQVSNYSCISLIRLGVDWQHALE